MSTETGPVSVPKSAARRAMCATLALEISFLLGRHAMLGHEPPTQRRSTTATRRPARAMFQASNLPPPPLPRIRISKCSGLDISSFAYHRDVERAVDDPQPHDGLN